MMVELRKPAYGAPCNRCGLCCQVGLCRLGQRTFERFAGPCPALERDENGPGFKCGLVSHPARYVPERAARHGEARLSAAAALIVAAGVGCDARGEDEARSPGLEERASRRRRDMAAQLEDAAAAWSYHTRTPAQLAATIALVRAAERAAGKRAVAPGATTEEMEAARLEQIGKRSYAESLSRSLEELRGTA